MLHYRLRSLQILLAVVPPVGAIGWISYPVWVPVVSWCIAVGILAQALASSSRRAGCYGERLDQEARTAIDLPWGRSEVPDQLSGRLQPTAGMKEQTHAHAQGESQADRNHGQGNSKIGRSGERGNGAVVADP